jgi:hypothetical protein
MLGLMLWLLGADAIAVNYKRKKMAVEMKSIIHIQTKRGHLYTKEKC